MADGCVLSVGSNPYRGERRTSARFRLEANARTFNSASRLRIVALVVGVSIHHPPRRSTSWLCAFLLGTSRMM